MKSPFATGSLILPFAIAVFGVLHAVFGPHAEGDWLGMGIFLKAGIWLGIAGVLSILLSITSFVRKEPRRVLSLLLAVPYLLYLGGIGVNLVTADRNRAESTKLKGDYEDFRLKLIEDPSLALEIDWESVWDVRRTVLAGTFQESSVPFTLEQLRDLHANFPSIRDHLFTHEACDSEFLSAHFEEALSLCRDDVNCWRLASICSNKNTPAHLLELVANATDLPVGAVYPARDTLKRIRREPDAAGQPATRPLSK
jgi:hypothetical protein